jgi:hypothetical protein
VAFVLDTVAPATLAAPYSPTSAWSVETTIKSLAGFSNLQDLHDGLVAQNADTLEGRKARFVTRVALALAAEREEAHAEALATQPAPTNRPCDGCPGDGVYRFAGGFFENGVWKGKTGQCVRCQGKGTQTPADVKRCEYYDNHVRRVYA